MISCNRSNKMKRAIQTSTYRTLLAACGLAVSLGGCSSGGNTDVRSLLAIGRLAFAPPQRVTIKQAAAIPYATIGVRIGGGAQAIATLATDDGAVRLWASGQDVMIAIAKGGQIQRTVGLEHNLSWLMPAGGQDAFLSAPSARRRSVWSADFADLAVYSATIQCDEILSANVQIRILGNLVATRRTNVRCVAPELKWTFQNTYWTDPQTGQVWRSIQHIHPKMAPLEVETLRPPS
jgi:hypothetical protein